MASLTQWTSLSKLWGMVKVRDREAWCAAVRGVAKSRTRLSQLNNKTKSTRAKEISDLAGPKSKPVTVAGWGLSPWSRRRRRREAQRLGKDSLSEARLHRQGAETSWIQKKKQGCGVGSNRKVRRRKRKAPVSKVPWGYPGYTTWAGGQEQSSLLRPEVLYVFPKQGCSGQATTRWGCQAPLHPERAQPQGLPSPEPPARTSGVQAPGAGGGAGVPGADP